MSLTDYQSRGILQEEEDQMRQTKVGGEDLLVIDVDPKLNALRSRD